MILQQLVKYHGRFKMQQFSVFALSGGGGFDQTSGSACEGNEGEEGFDFYDLDVVSVEYNEGVVSTVITNAGNETTPVGGYTWIFVDGSPVLVDTPPSFEFGSSNDFTYDISEFVIDLAPGNHTLTVWVNGGESEPLGAEYGLSEDQMNLFDFIYETYYENNMMTIDFEIPFIYGCMDPWAGNLTLMLMQMIIILVIILVKNQINQAQLS